MSLHVERLGCGRDLVLLHGWGLHGGVWAGALGRLGERFHVHAVDLPGHGLSSAVDFAGLDEVVDALADSLPEASLVCGWSLGGLLAQRLATRHPAKVRRLALVSTTPCFVQRGDWPQAMRAETLEAFAANLASDRAATLRTFVGLNVLGGANGRPAMRELAANLLERDGPSASALAAGLKVLRETDLRATAGSIVQPALVLHGQRDALAPVAAGRWLAKHLPSARLVVLPDVAHLPFVTHRDIFVDALEALDG